MLCLENQYVKFIKKWKNEIPNKELLIDYKTICKDLLYQKEEIVREITKILKLNITLWSQENSKIYKNLEKIISKEDLLEKEKWHVRELKKESQLMKTSGTTTSKPFSYLRWDIFLNFIECENHYDLILDEFEIENNFNLFYFFNNKNYDLKKDFSKKNNVENFMERHGRKRNTTSHYANFKFLQKQTEEYYKKILDYLLDNKIDVIFCPGSITNSLCHYIKKFNIKNKICTLLSNSYEEILNKDVEFLLENNLVGNVCNHMRCWDGGATFFNCKHNTYHLLDNLSWCDEFEGKLISTDYFSLPSPFVNYWNGDYCSIENCYKRCKCGRLYRPFKFLRSRPFAVKGNSIFDIKDKLLSVNMKGIKQIKYVENSVLIILSEPATEEQKQKISKAFEKINFNFILEN